MGEQNISRAELAKRLGTSRAYVTQILRTNFNPTIETVVKIAIALDANLSIQLKPCTPGKVQATESRAARVVAHGPYSRIEQSAAPIVSDKPRRRRSIAGQKNAFPSAR
jgi:transcriptional regulator with XRE-family HTH domain